MPRLATEHGVSLIEAVVAAAIVVTVAAGVAQLLVWARRAAWSAGVRTTAVSIAVQKVEELRSLSWSVDAAGAPLSDATTNLANDPPSADGTGLRPSPAGVLEQNTPGFVDYLDQEGKWCGTGARPPGQAAFVRRWAIEPFSADPADTIVLHVIVLPIADANVSPARSALGVRLRTVRTRVVQ